MRFCFVLPSTGDGDRLGLPQPQVQPTFEHLRSVAVSADAGGFDSLLVTTGQRNNHFGREAAYVDSVVTAAGLINHATRIKFLVAIRTGLIHPALCARMMSTLDVFSRGRVMVNVVSGGAPLSSLGESMEHDARYERLDELIQILRQLWTQDSAFFEGRYFTLQDASSYPRPFRSPHPPIYVSGRSAMARWLGAKEADCHLVPGMNLAEAADFATDIFAGAQKRHRSLRLGIHFYIVARESKGLALEAARRLVSGVSIPVDHEAVSSVCDGVAPVLWPGFREVWQDSSFALVGSYTDVAETLQRYAEIGYSTVVVSAFPALEEVHRLSDNLLSALAD
jgi:alkanesulfonate monooxygenase